MIVLPVLLQNIIEIANVAEEILLIFLYLSLLSKRKIDKLPLVFSYLIATAFLSAVVLLSDNIFLNLVLTTVLISLISFLCFDDTIKHRIFWIAIYLLIISVSEPIVIGILCIANMGTPEDFLQSGLGRYLGMIGTDLIYLWLIGMMHRIINKRIRDLPIKYWILIITIPIISIFLLQTMLDSFTVKDSLNYISLSISLIGIIFINISMFNFFESYEDKIKLKYLETLKQQEQENYKLLALSHKQVKELKHDIENQFSVLNGLMKSGDNAAAMQYLDKLNSYVRTANRICYTGNNVIDSIVNIKGSLAQTYGIEFICKVNIITSIKADELELCRIIGNGLDNAIEDREKLMIVISNTSDEVDTTALSSTKKEKGLHGIGISSIKSSVERLDGLVKFDYADGIFKLNIMVQNCLPV